MIKETAEMLRVMPREMRMMTERVLSLTSLPKGFVLAETDLVMYSQKLGLGGFALLERRFDAFRHADTASFTILSESAGSLRLDAAGQHAWWVIPTLLDLLGELCSRTERPTIAVENCFDPAELAVALALAARRGLAVEFADNTPPVLAATARPVSGSVVDDDPILRDLHENGTEIDAALWWRIYHLAQKALTPDSVVSRRHAGPLIVTEDGTVIGRKNNDDETDISFLVAPAPEHTREGAKS
jgi:hypothetical protein